MDSMVSTDLSDLESDEELVDELDLAFNLNLPELFRVPVRRQRLRVWLSQRSSESPAWSSRTWTRAVKFTKNGLPCPMSASVALSERVAAAVTVSV